MSLPPSVTLPPTKKLKIQRITRFLQITNRPSSSDDSGLGSDLNVYADLVVPNSGTQPGSSASIANNVSSSTTPADEDIDPTKYLVNLGVRDKYSNQLFSCGFKVKDGARIIDCPTGSKMKNTKYQVTSHIIVRHGSARQKEDVNRKNQERVKKQREDPNYKAKCKKCDIEAESVVDLAHHVRLIHGPCKDKLYRPLAKNEVADDIWGPRSSQDKSAEDERQDFEDFQMSLDPIDREVDSKTSYFFYIAIGFDKKELPPGVVDLKTFDVKSFLEAKDKELRKIPLDQKDPNNPFVVFYDWEFLAL